MYTIPLTSDPNQTFRCTIPIEGNNLTLLFKLRYNSESEYWAMTLTDGQTNEMLVDSVPLLAGEYPAANLLEQYAYLNIGSAVIVKMNPDAEGANPGPDNLGTDFKLIWSDTL